MPPDPMNRLTGPSPAAVVDDFAAFRERQILVLEQLAAGASVAATLEAVIAMIQEQSPGTIASVLLLSPDGKHLRHGAAPDLPPAYRQAVDGEPIGPAAGSCGTAIYTRRRIIVTDIVTDPLWAQYRPLAFAHDLRSCWSEPIFDSRGEVLGSFAMYHREVATPTEMDLQIIRVAAHLAGVAIEQERRAQAEQQAAREREAMERKLVEAQKLESLGVLAGGVAHDFNNLLTGILGNASLARMQLGGQHPEVGSLLDSIEETSHRAADLCKQMLAYAGRGRFILEKVDLSVLARECARLLEVSITKHATLRFDLEENLPLVECDATQLRQIVMNLVINASEAIGERPGQIRIATGVQHADRAYFAEAHLAPELPEGPYVFLEISDNGIGMNAATKARIFDPFFTTKFAGRGLGLAAVLGIVRGHQGALKVYSELGSGTNFKLLLPIAEGAPAPVPPRAADISPWRGRGEVLLVDDEETVRVVGRRMLEHFGFSVVTAAHGLEALDLFRPNPRRFCLVVLDLTMPHLNGVDTYRELRALHPEVRVLLVSGFNEYEALTRLAGQGVAGFLQKPFMPADLEQKIRDILG